MGQLADLRYHLSHVRRHPVFACCGQMFQDLGTFDAHVHRDNPRIRLHEGHVEVQQLAVCTK